MSRKKLLPGRSLAILLPVGALVLAVLTGWPGSLFQATPASAAGHQHPPRPSERTPVTGGPTPDLVFFYTGQVMGWVDPCG